MPWRRVRPAQTQHDCGWRRRQWTAVQGQSPALLNWSGEEGRQLRQHDGVRARRPHHARWRVRLAWEAFVVSGSGQGPQSNA